MYFGTNLGPSIDSSNLNLFIHFVRNAWNRLVNKWIDMQVASMGTADEVQKETEAETPRHQASPPQTANKIRHGRVQVALKPKLDSRLPKP